MEIQKAIEKLKMYKPDLANAMAIEALEKQMPKRPCDIASYYCTGEKNGACSICGGHVQGREKYCPNCGQKIEWEGRK